MGSRLCDLPETRDDPLHPTSASSREDTESPPPVGHRGAEAGSPPWARPPRAGREGSHSKGVELTHAGRPDMIAGVGACILMVEDDERIRTSVRLLLEDEGHTVVEADSAEEALGVLERRAVHIALVDVMLPGMDGFELCRRLRSAGDLPILMLTARTDSHDVVAGLEAGADDYLTKPFVPKELSARIRALLRRTGRCGGPEALVFGDLEVLPDAGVVRRAGEEVALTKTEFRLICELATNSGRVLSRESLLQRVWGYDYFGDSRLVDVHVRRLRNKVESDPAQPDHVVTVRGLGYKLVP